eukprot:gene1350-1705_t
MSNHPSSMELLKEIEKYALGLKKDIKIQLDLLSENQNKNTNSNNNNNNEEIHEEEEEEFDNSNLIEEMIEKKSLEYQSTMTNYLKKISLLFPQYDPKAINEALESLILLNLFGLLFPINMQKDVQLKRLIRYGREQSIDFLELPSEKTKSIPWENAIAELSHINLFESPRDKIMCILRFCRIISKGLSQSGKSFGADEFVNCLVYIILQANPSYLYSNLKYIELFRSNDLLVSEAGYYFVSMNMAVAFIESKFTQDYQLFEEEQNNNDQNSTSNPNSEIIIPPPSQNFIFSTNSFDSSSSSNNCQVDNSNNDKISLVEVKVEANDNNITFTNNENSENNVEMNPLSNEEVEVEENLDEIEMKEQVEEEDEDPLFDEILRRSMEIITNITSLAITEGNYDARIRTGLKRFSLKLSPSTLGLELLSIESSLGQNILNAGNNNNSNNTGGGGGMSKILNVFERTVSNHRTLKVAGAAIAGGSLLALTGGLAAPLIGAAMHLIGIGAVVTSMTTAGISGTAIASLLFGAAGATISAERMNQHTSGLKEFSFKKVNETFGLHVVIGALGWLEDENGVDDQVRWEATLFSGVLCLGEVYTIDWETKLLHSLHQSLKDYKTKVEDSSSFAKFTTKMMHDAILPSASLLEAGSIISTCWGKVKDRSQKAGKLLADEIIARRFGRRPITLVGVSMGARMLFFCLLELAEKKAYGFIENVILIGAPAPVDIQKWVKIRKIVAGRLVNCYSPTDLLLQYCYESNNITDDGLKYVACGYSPIKIKKRNTETLSTVFGDSFIFKSFKSPNDSSADNIETTTTTTSTTTTTTSTSNSTSPTTSSPDPKKLKTNKTEKKKKDVKEKKNVDVSSAITSHLDYQRESIQSFIFSHVNISSCDPCAPILIVPPSLMEWEQSKKEGVNKNNITDQQQQQQQPPIEMENLNYQSLTPNRLDQSI